MTPSTWLGSRVLITGAAGFLGATMARALVPLGADIVGWVRPAADTGRLTGILPNLTLMPVDLADHARVLAAMEETRPDCVFHFAFPGGHPDQPGSREAMLTGGILGTANLLEALGRQPGARLVHAGSFLELRPGDSPLAETDPIDPLTFRGAVKAAAAVLCRQAAREAGIPAVLLRIFSVFGPMESADRFIPAAIRAALHGLELPLAPAGSRRDLIYSEDVIDACLKAAFVDTPPGEIFHIGSGVGTTNEEVIQWIERLTNRTIRTRPGAFPVRPADVPHCAADIRKAQRLLGWEPRHTVAAGLQKEIAWIRASGECGDAS